MPQDRFITRFIKALLPVLVCYFKHPSIDKKFPGEAKNHALGTLTAKRLLNLRRGGHWRGLNNRGQVRFWPPAAEVKDEKMKCEEGRELITGLVDDELSPVESSSIREHLGVCPNCPQIYSLESSMKRMLRQAAMDMHTPPELKKRILRQQRRSLRRAWWSELRESLPRIASVVGQAAVIASLLVIPILSARYWLTSPYFPIVPGIFQSYRQITEGEIVPARMENLAELKEKLTQLVNGEFAPMAYDFSSMNIHLVGGLLQEIANRKILVAVYQGNGLTIICYTFIGSEGDAPEIAEMFFDAEKGMNFHQFYYTHTNAVMHREGKIMCILMSQIARDELFALARAKAHADHM